MAMRFRFRLVAAVLVAVGVSGAVPQGVQAAVLHVPGEFPSIGEAVDEAAAGDTILVAAGVYTGELNKNIDPGGRDIVFIGSAGSTATIIDCEGAGRGFEFQTGETRATIVCGFTVRNGDVWDILNEKGGAVRCFRSDPTFIDCVFENCMGMGGGAVMGYEASPSFEECQFLDNWGSWGGGMSLWSARDASVTKCVFRGNRGDGAAIESECSVIDISWSIFVDNLCSSYANGILIAGTPSPSIRNCTFAANTNQTVVRAAYGATPHVSNTVVAFNNSSAMRCDSSSTPLVEHCISYGNSWGNVLCAGASSYLYSDPLFCGLDQHDVTICSDSPCAPGNNPWGVLVGANDIGCGPCATAVMSASWGAIKALYR